MPRETITFSDDQLDFGDAESIVEHEMRENSPFSVEVTGRDSATSTTIQASAHTANLMRSGGMIEVVVDAPDYVVDAIRGALESQSGPDTDRYNDAEFTDVGGSSGPDPYTVIDTYDHGFMIVKEELMDEVRNRTSIRREYDTVPGLERATDEFALESGQEPEDSEIIAFKPEIAERLRTNTGDNFEGVGETPAGGARATEMLPDDAELQATMRLYENGMLVIDRNGDKELYETAAGFFLTAGRGSGAKLGMAEAYTIDEFERTYTEADVRRALNEIEEIMGGV